MLPFAVMNKSMKEHAVNIHDRYISIKNSSCYRSLVINISIKRSQVRDMFLIIDPSLIKDLSHNYSLAYLIHLNNSLPFGYYKD